jgi:hypothetical protein
MKFGSTPAVCAAEDARHRLEAGGLHGVLRGEPERRSPVVDRRRVAGRDAAPLRNTGWSLASASTVLSARTHSSRLTTTGSPFFCGIVTGTSSPAKASLPRGGGALVRLGGEGVLIGAGDAVLFRHVLGRLAHRLKLEAGREPGVRVAPAEGGVVDGRRRAIEALRRASASRRARASCSPRRRRSRTRPRRARSSGPRRPRPRGPIRRGGSP